MLEEFVGQFQFQLLLIQIQDMEMQFLSVDGNLVKELEVSRCIWNFLRRSKMAKKMWTYARKRSYTQEEYTEKLSAAIDARENKDFFIVARTDARATKGLR